MEFLPGITQKRIRTDRLEIAYLEAGEQNQDTVVLVHGNVSCGWFFDELMLVLAGKGYHVYAPDMRGYGHSEGLPVDASRGVRDFSDDLASFAKALNLPKFHLLGWSLGGNIVMQYAMDNPGTIRSLILEAPGSPFGFGGTKGLNGQPVFADGAGSGGGGVNPDFLKRVNEGDRSEDAPTSPRTVLKNHYVKPGFSYKPASEELYLSAMLSIKTGVDNYPGDFTPSENWPNIAPGKKGTNNTIAAGNINQAAFANIEPKPPVLWVRGDSDVIVSDNSFYDFGMLGKIGAVPGWPGEEVCPPQPMVSQTRAVLDQYQGNGGQYTEVVLDGCGHSPHIEKAQEVNELILKFIGAN